MVRLDYNLKFTSFYFSLSIYIRPKQVVDIQAFAEKYNLQVYSARNGFGRGDSYKSLKNDKWSDAFETRYGNRGRYFF
jgi:hypothetical protein